MPCSSAVSPVFVATLQSKTTQGTHRSVLQCSMSCSAAFQHVSRSTAACFFLYCNAKRWSTAWSSVCYDRVQRDIGFLRTRAKIEVHHFFSNIPLNFGASSRPLPKTDLEINNTAMVPDEKIPWPRYTTRTVPKKKAYFQRFWG